MQKIALTIVVICSFSLQSNAQVVIGLLFGDKLKKGPVEFGLHGIVNRSNLIISNGGKAKSKLGFGLYFNYEINDEFYLSSSLFFTSPKGQKNITSQDPLYQFYDTSIFKGISGVTIERTLNYIELPIIIECRPMKHFGLGVGIYMAWLTSAIDHYSVNKYGGTVSYETSIKEELNQFDFGLNAGIHYHFMKNSDAQIRLSYYRGLMSVFKDDSFRYTENQVIQVGVLIPIKFGVKSKD